MSESSGWQRLRPCPFCDHNDWCALSPGGRFINCMRVSAGSIKGKVDCDGTPYYVHYAPGHGPGDERAIEDPAECRAMQDALAARSGVAAAPDGPTPRTREDLDAVYRDLLRRCDRLSAAQEAAMLARGLSAEAARRHGIHFFGPRRKVIARKVSDKCDVAGVPGFWRDGDAWRIAGASGVGIPVRDHEGLVVGILIRPDEVKGDGGKYRWLSSDPAIKKDGGSPKYPGGTRARAAAHVPLHPGITDTSTIRITEGALKAILGVELSPILTLGMSLCSTWRQVLPALERLGPKCVLIALDADHCTNPAVAWGLVHTFEGLTEHGRVRGYEVAIEVWDAEKGKGIDDFLHAGGISEVVEGVAAESYVEGLRRKFPKRPGGGLPNANAPGGGDFHRTDMGNARRLVAWHGEDIHYVSTWDKWICWQGSHWRLDETRRLPDLAQQTAARMLAEAVGDDEESWAFDTQMSARLRAMVTTAEPLRAITHRCLDRDPFLLPCLNGTIDLRTGALRDSRRDDLLTKVCPHHYDPAATCPAWEDGLLKIFGGDAELVAYFQRVVGYCLTGDVSESIVVILHGGGSNGKSLVIVTLQKVIGPDYAGVGPDELLRSDHDQGHPTAFAKLFGMRLVTLAETSESGRLNETLVKKMSGGDRIQARRMREDFWEFDPTHKIMLATNHLPKVAGVDDGIWRRLRLLPFNVRFWDAAKKETGPPELEADKRLKDKLAAEMPGILAWAVRGCMEWRRVGLNQPAAVTQATDAYKADQDIITAFFAECCHLGDGWSCQATPLYKRYVAWHEETGREGRPLSMTKFGRRLKARNGLSHDGSSGFVIYSGVGLRVPDDDGAEGLRVAEAFPYFPECAHRRLHPSRLRGGNREKPQQPSNPQRGHSTPTCGPGQNGFVEEVL